MESIVKNEEWNGMHVHTIPTSQFKSIMISFKMTNALTKKEAIKRNMLSLLMGTSSFNFKDNRQFVRKFDALYGAYFSTGLGSLGKASIIHVNFEFIDPRYIKDPNYIEKMVDLIHEVLLCPNIIDGKYDEVSFRQCQKEMGYRFQDEKEDKDEYAINKTIELMGEGSIFSIPNFGYESQMGELDPFDLANYYQKCILEDRKDLYIVGDLSDELIDALKEKIVFPTQKNDFEAAYTFESTKKEVLKVMETSNVASTKIIMGYTLKGCYLSNKNHLYILMNDILGGSENSLLFNSIREEDGLCYMISSNYDANNGVILISGAIDHANIDEYIHKVELCISQLQSGQYDLTIFEGHKTRIMNASKEIKDHAYGLIRSLFTKEINHKQSSISTYEALKDINKEDIVQVSADLKLDTIFILTGDENE